jgi:hypothetical protein
MSLMPKILVGRELEVDALRLKDHADLPPHARRLLRRVAAHDGGAAGGRNHQRGKNPEERGLAAAIRTEQAEQLRRTHVERNSVQSGAVLIAMHQVLYGNDGAAEAGVTSGRRRRMQKLSMPRGVLG